MSERQIPQPMMQAQSALDAIKGTVPDEQFLALRKYLLTVARIHVKEGTEFSDAALQEHTQKGLEQNGANEPQQQKRSYDSIVTAFPAAPKPAEFKHAREEFYYYAMQGDVENCSRIIDQKIVVEGWDKDPISYEHLVEPACQYGHLNLLKFAVEKDPELIEWRVASECSHAIANGRMDILRYVVEDLKIDLEGKYSASPYSQYVKYAIKKGRWDIAEYITPGFFKDMRSNTELRDYLFQSAFDSGRIDYVQKFLDGGMTFEKMDVLTVSLSVALISDEVIQYLIDAKFFTPQHIKVMYEDMGFRSGANRQKILQQAMAETPMGFFENLLHKWKLFKDFRVATHYVIAAELAKHIGIPHMLWSRNIKQAEGFADHWRRMTGTVPYSAGEYDPARIKKSVFDDVTALMKKEGLDDSVAERYAYHASSLFCSTDRVLQYLEKWGKGGKQPLHDIVHQIDLPRAGEIDVKSWGDAVLQCGPEMARLTAFSDRLKAPSKTADDKRYSIAATRAEVAKFAYRKGNQNPEFARLCLNQQWKENYFNDGLKIIGKYRRKYGANDNAKMGSRIPDITIDGEEFGMPGYKFRKLKDGDLRGLLLGEYTGCCQHLANAGSECAEHGFLSVNGGFYVVEDKDGKIVGETWAWRGKNKELVFDSLEYLGDRMNADNWQKICELAAEKVAQESKDISAINIGTGGKTPSLSFKQAAQGAVPIDYSGYRDSKGTQYNVWNRAAARIS